MTLTRLLCPIDFSEASTDALEQAAALARRSGARLYALAVLPSISPFVEQMVAEATAVEGGAADDLRRWREQAEAQCRPIAASGLDVTLEVVEAHPAEAILDRVNRLGIDLVVMGTHGASGFRRLVLGSVTEKVLRRATCPVLTVPPRARDTHASTFSRVLAAVDFSPCSFKAVDAAAAMARESGGMLTLLHVLEWPWHDEATSAPEGVPPAQAAALQEYRRYLEQGAVDRLKAVADGLPAGTRATTAVRFGKAWVETLAAAEDARADLLVLGVIGRSAVSLGFFGSTANHVVRAATCPVLTIRS
jgi:nucleotide-binding universal stress UspA family protein